MTDYIKIIINLLKKELSNSEFHKDILQPMVKWIFFKTLPFIICITILNFFLTIFAVSFVLFISSRK